MENNLDRVREVVDGFDLFQDWPWPLIYSELDKMYPGSKFILTTRKSEEVWLESLKQHALKTPPKKHCRKLAYGYNYPHLKKGEHLEFYRKHNENVRDYFGGREEDFIELCWENGDGFEELCEFLGCGVPAAPFPHDNKRTDNPVSKRRLLANAVLSLIGN